ncbi:MAG: response regulator [SAR202 cluster bacterium]|nr:response regulator [SAR202 cluster bacterium]
MLTLFGRRSRRVETAGAAALSPQASRSWVNGPWNILVAAGDVSVLARAVRALREDPRYVVHTSNDGRLALECARQVRPDMVLVDPSLPTPDGSRVHESLRDALGARARIVVVSNGGREPMADGNLGVGFRAEDLLKMARALLDSRPIMGAGA